MKAIALWIVFILVISGEIQYIMYVLCTHTHYIVYIYFLYTLRNTKVKFYLSYFSIGMILCIGSHVVVFMLRCVFD